MKNKIMRALSLLCDVHDSLDDEPIRLYGVARKDTLELLPCHGQTLRMTRQDNIKIRRSRAFQNTLVKKGLTDADVKYVVAFYRKAGEWKTQK
jgi:hypothetical protein